MPGATVDEAAELILQAYERCYDLEIAFSRVPLPEAVKAQILADEVFNARVQQLDYDRQEGIMQNLITLADEADKDSVRLTATIKLGEILYERRFRNSQFAQSKTVPDRVNLVPGPSVVVEESA